VIGVSIDPEAHVVQAVPENAMQLENPAGRTTQVPEDK